MKIMEIVWVLNIIIGIVIFVIEGKKWGFRKWYSIVVVILGVLYFILTN